MAMINTGKDVFQDCFHVGCLFHLKQAWRRYLITKIGFLPEQIGSAMRSCVLDLLTVISPDEIEEYGIPYVRNCIEKNLCEDEIKMWDTFWYYFMDTWMGKLVKSWNICDADGTHRDLLNRTNNAMESYNRAFNSNFDKKPSLIEFVEKTEQESRAVEDRLDGIRKHKEKRPDYRAPTIPEIPNAYTAFKAEKDKKKRKKKRRTAD